MVEEFYQTQHQHQQQKQRRIIPVSHWVSRRDDVRSGVPTSWNSASSYACQAVTAKKLLNWIGLNFDGEFE